MSSDGSVDRVTLVSEIQRATMNKLKSMYFEEVILDFMGYLTVESLKCIRPTEASGFGTINN